jgi:hypothetical protein
MITRKAAGCMCCFGLDRSVPLAGGLPTHSRYADWPLLPAGFESEVSHGVHTLQLNCRVPAAGDLGSDHFSPESIGSRLGQDSRRSLVVSPRAADRSYLTIEHQHEETTTESGLLPPVETVARGPIEQRVRTCMSAACSVLRRRRRCARPL